MATNLALSLRERRKSRRKFDHQSNVHTLKRIAAAAPLSRLDEQLRREGFQNRYSFLTDYPQFNKGLAVRARVFTVHHG